MAGLVNNTQVEDNEVRIILIGGSSGVGKTYSAQKLASRLPASLLLLDDIRIAIQTVTTQESHPDLHIFLNYRPEQWCGPQNIVSDWIKVGCAVENALKSIIEHHLTVQSEIPIIIEGDGVLPRLNYLNSKKIRCCFIIENNKTTILKNLQKHGRGFNVWGKTEQDSLCPGKLVIRSMAGRKS